MAADPLENDELLLLKKRARRRLVGAVAFMLVALVVLSSVMESRPLPTAQPAVKVAIDGLGSKAESTPPNAFVSPADSASASEGLAVRTPQNAVAAPETAVATAAAKAALGGADHPPVQAAPPSRPKDPAGSTGKAAATSQAKKTSTPQDDKKPAEAAKSGSLSASVIALSDAGKATELQRKLKARGLNAYTEQVQVGGKTLTRVRLGPYATRAELDKARAKLALMGL